MRDKSKTYLSDNLSRIKEAYPDTYAAIAEAVETYSHLTEEGIVSEFSQLVQLSQKDQNLFQQKIMALSILLGLEYAAVIKLLTFNPASISENINLLAAEAKEDPIKTWDRTKRDVVEFLTTLPLIGRL